MYNYMYLVERQKDNNRILTTTLMYVIVAWRHRSRVEQNGSNDYSAAGEVAGCARR